MLGIEDFVTSDFILSFTGMVIIVTGLTQFVKHMLGEGCTKCRSKFIAYFWSLILCTAAAVIMGNYSDLSSTIKTILVWGVNSVIIWFVSMKSYEEIKEISGLKKTQNKNKE